MDISAFIQNICIYALPVLFAITLHEAAHAFAARHFGDPTAYLMGRMTLNPVKHIDPFGTIALPLLCLLLPGSFLFGWAKPVPVNFAGLRNPKKDMRWVALAGPGANLVMMLLWTLILGLVLHAAEGDFVYPLRQMAQAGVQINIVLMILNLIPIPPLDGGRVLVSLLPEKAARTVAKVEPYGMILLLVLMFTKVLFIIMVPFMNLFYLLVQNILRLFA
ncbi:site-2 protease family protein [Silvimonas amylolytica]|uniref:Peptidase M50 n=1 Tax=Silvimonas amylolytica TaxID=449663 RepID=A0ABQ2PGT3_9NEIS|nr:site-2 protease family protein [Silvimonas amylolytica]GGP24474.1 peptidase M50 [Silvimonas amylolytica]